MVNHFFLSVAGQPGEKFFITAYPAETTGKSLISVVYPGESFCCLICQSGFPVPHERLETVFLPYLKFISLTACCSVFHIPCACLVQTQQLQLPLKIWSPSMESPLTKKQYEEEGRSIIYVLKSISASAYPSEGDGNPHFIRSLKSHIRGEFPEL